MSARERKRLDALSRVKRKEITVVEAAGLMGLSLRQARRVWKNFKARGDRGLVHQLRGKVSNRRLPEAFRDKVVRRHQQRYHDFGPTLACEKLAQEDGLHLSPDTLVAILKERQIYEPRRRRSRHRKRRERRQNFGAMIQIDGSHHDWFEGRAPGCVLMVMVDDATGKVLARFYPAETTQAAFDIFGCWAKTYGIPQSLYADRHSIYRDEDHPEKPTQVGRALAELGVELILARSPQAKGRVERKHQVFQDRLVKELRLREISDLDQANILLEKILLPEFNRRFAIKAQGEADLHRQAPPGLEEILCVQEDRTVGQDWCVRWKNRWLQIQPQPGALGLAGKKVKVKALASGTLILERQGQKLVFKELTGKPAAWPAAKAKVPQINNRKWKPGPNHPYNREARAARARAAASPPQAAARARMDPC